MHRAVLGALRAQDSRSRRWSARREILRATSLHGEKKMRSPVTCEGMCRSMRDRRSAATVSAESETTAWARIGTPCTATSLLKNPSIGGSSSLIERLACLYSLSTPPPSSRRCSSFTSGARSLCEQLYRPPPAIVASAHRASLRREKHCAVLNMRPSAGLCSGCDHCECRDSRLPFMLGFAMCRSVGVCSACRSPSPAAG